MEYSLKGSKFIQELTWVQSLKEAALGAIKEEKSWDWGLDQQHKEPKNWQGFLY